LTNLFDIEHRGPAVLDCEFCPQKYTARDLMCQRYRITRIGVEIAVAQTSATVIVGLLRHPRVKTRKLAPDFGRWSR
jgi:hypothetical protein